MESTEALPRVRLVSFNRINTSDYRGVIFKVPENFNFEKAWLDFIGTFSSLPESERPSRNKLPDLFISSLIRAKTVERVKVEGPNISFEVLHDYDKSSFGQSEHLTYKIGESFSTPEQTTDFDFEAWIGEYLFNESFIRYDREDNELTKRLLSQPEKLKNMPAQEYQFMTILTGEESSQNIMNELHITPMSVSEWQYLFSNMTEKQLIGDTLFFVNVEGTDCIVSTMFNYGGGPHSYSIEVREVSVGRPKSYLTKPKVVIPKNAS